MHLLQFLCTLVLMSVIIGTPAFRSVIGVIQGLSSPSPHVPPGSDFCINTPPSSSCYSFPNMEDPPDKPELIQREDSHGITAEDLSCVCIFLTKQTTPVCLLFLSGLRVCVTAAVGFV
ncbi:hypothetical protein AMECASPLE_019506 [Ameca splendens]|uniref:Uncharacterized protein n=1 Tax=Ameca splendens TaxID=208324 RepID=A0ABV0YPY2_9TELE